MDEQTNEKQSHPLTSRTADRPDPDISAGISSGRAGRHQCDKLAAFFTLCGRCFPTRVLWGDTHLHTAVSVDAGMMNTLGQEEALRFGRGEEVTTTHGLRAKLSRPLDFLVVCDHAEIYDLMRQLLKGDPDILAQEKGKRWSR